jgi:hypothetical protein
MGRADRCQFAVTTMPSQHTHHHHLSTPPPPQAPD